MKRPAFQFYPSDWRADTALQSCSLSAQGLWINLIAIAHDCTPYGHLVVNGRPMPSAQIARLVGLSGKECDRLLAELSEAGVTSLSDTGAIYSRRMVRDEDLRNRRAEGGHAGAQHGVKGAEHGSKGGRPRKRSGDEQPPKDEHARGFLNPPKNPPLLLLLHLLLQRKTYRNLRFLGVWTTPAARLRNVRNRNAGSTGCPVAPLNGWWSRTTRCCPSCRRCG